MNIHRPKWAIPSAVKAITTTREEGYSIGPYAGFNLSDMVGDNPHHVAQNRHTLQAAVGLQREIVWLNQMHRGEILNLDRPYENSGKLEFDGSFTTQSNKVCLTLDADSLPLLLCDVSGIAVAAVHCCWRSILGGVIKNAVSLFKENTTSPILAWTGPAIGPDFFEVGQDVESQFEDKSAFCLIPSSQKTPKYLGNISQLVKNELLKEGLLEAHISQDLTCTYLNSEKYYSYRRDKGVTGRIATLIWKQNSN